MYDERCRCRFRFRIRCRIWIRIRSERWAEQSWASPVSYDKVARLKKSSDKTTKCVNRWGNMRNNTLPVTEYKSPSALVASWFCFFFFLFPPELGSVHQPSGCGSLSANLVQSGACRWPIRIVGSRIVTKKNSRKYCVWRQAYDHDQGLESGLGFPDGLPLSWELWDYSLKWEVPFESRDARHLIEVQPRQFNAV